MANKPKIDQPRFVISQNDRLKLLRGEVLVKVCYKTQICYSVCIPGGSDKITLEDLVLTKLDQAA